LWGAASVGLVLSATTLWMGALTTEGYELASYAYAPTADSISYLLGYLSWIPLLFVVIAAIRNGLGRSWLRPSSANAGKRALIFFVILTSVVASLKIYGE